MVETAESPLGRAADDLRSEHIEEGESDAQLMSCGAGAISVSVPPVARAPASPARCATGDASLEARERAASASSRARRANDGDEEGEEGDMAPAAVRAGVAAGSPPEAAPAIGAFAAAATTASNAFASLSLKAATDATSGDGDACAASADGDGCAASADGDGADCALRPLRLRAELLPDALPDVARWLGALAAGTETGDGTASPVGVC